ncbi:MAG: energy transducer TonB [Kofleriaceae bacterium]
MKFVAFSTLLVAACATGSTALDGMPQTPTVAGARLRIDATPPGEPMAGVASRFDLAARATVARLPAPIDPELPTADRIGRSIRQALGEEASVHVEMCVSPDGHVLTATLIDGSTMAAFDRAVMRDVMAWQFEEMPGPSHVKSCQRRTITYRPHS